MKLLFIIGMLCLLIAFGINIRDRYIIEKNLKKMDDLWDAMNKKLLELINKLNEKKEKESIRKPNESDV